MKAEKIRLFDNKKTLTVYIICNALTVLTIIGSIVSAIIMKGRLTKTAEHIGLCVFAILFYNLPLFLRYKFKLHIPTFLQITVTIFAIMHFVFGEIFRVYDYSLFFDKILHTASGVIFAICAFSLVNGLNDTERGLFKLSPLFVAIFSFCFSLAIGYLWEVFEFTADSLIGSNMQRWQDSFYPAIVNGEEQLISNYGQGSGLIDTLGDMIVNMAGAAMISIIGYIWLKKSKEKMSNLLIKQIKPIAIVFNGIATQSNEAITQSNDDTIQPLFIKNNENSDVNNNIKEVE